MSPHQQRQATTDRLRAVADAVGRIIADDQWRLDTAFAMGCLTIEIGIGPVGHNRDSEPLEASNFRVILADLRTVDTRVKVMRLHSPTVGWVEEIVVPLDNPALADRVTHWTYRLAVHRAADTTDVAAVEAERAQPVPDVNDAPT